MKMHNISGTTKITGIIGYPLTYTLSPLMHNSAFNELGLDYCYVPFVVEKANLKQAIEGIKALNIVGINVTMPHKEAVLEYLDGLSDEARIIGAVNTIKNESGKLIGYNTDSYGFIKALEDYNYDVSQKNVVLLGAGGAAKAVAYALAKSGAKSITIIARSLDKAEKIKEMVASEYREILVKTLSFNNDLTDIMQIGDLVVNATPIGMKESGEQLPVFVSLINERHFIYDLIYTPQETALIKEAKKRHIKAINGAGMLAHQAAAAFEIWTGVSAPIEIMHKALLKGLKRGDRSADAKEENWRISS